MAEVYRQTPFERFRAIVIDYLAAYTPIREYRHVAGLNVTGLNAIGLNVTRSLNDAAELGDSVINVHTTRSLLQVNP